MAHRIDCAEEDGFMVQSEDETEAIDMIKRHAQRKPDMDLNDDQAREMMSQT